MKNSQLIQILRILSKQEMKELGELVHSPFFNKNKSVIALYDYFKKYHPELPDEKINKEIIYGKLFSGGEYGEEYNDGYMRKIMFTLANLAEDYLVYKGFKQNKPAVHDVLLQQYYERGSAELFTKTYHELVSFKKENKSYAEQFYYSYLSGYRNLAFGAEHKSVDFAKFAGKNDLLEPLEYLSAHYYSSIMNLYEYYLNTQRILNFETDIPYFENLISSFDKKVIAKHPLLQLHYNMIKMLTRPEEDKYFFDSKKLLVENEPKLALTEVENIYINLQNYCMRKIRANRPGYTGELFEIYKIELERSNYSEGKTISVVLYRNIIFTALQLKETSFAEEFAEKYSKYLPAENAKPNYLYSKAHIALKKKEFDKIGGYLSKIKTIDELMKADIKAMYIPVYYETGAIEQFYSMTDSFKHYLKNNQKLSDERKKLYETFISFSARLTAIKENYDEHRAELLEKEISEGINIINKGWMLEKITELKNKKGGV